MNKDEKLRRLLEMQEHPERYTDEEISQMMADEDCRLWYEQMLKGADAVFAEKETTKAEGLATPPIRQPRHKLSALRKIAAIFAGVILLSGVTYAAIRLVQSYTQAQTTETAEQPTERTATVKETTDSIAQKTTDEQPTDSIDLRPVVFEESELGTILQEIAAFHKCEVVYKNESAKHVRLYFTWDKKATIDDVVETFNMFERFHITRENQQLIVE